MNIPISFLVDDVVQVQHKWSAVPRNGDHVKLGHARTEYEVIDVIWTNSTSNDGPVVDVHLRRLK